MSVLLIQIKQYAMINVLYFLAVIYIVIFAINTTSIPFEKFSFKEMKIWNIQLCHQGAKKKPTFTGCFDSFGLVINKSIPGPIGKKVYILSNSEYTTQ